jgi:GGDEF domain-containing protein
MNRKIVTAFSAVCIAAALGAAASVAYRVLAADRAGREAARADFEGLRSVLSSVKSSAELADPGLRARLSARYETSSGLLLVDVYERGFGDRWRIPADSPYLPAAQAGLPTPAPAYPPASTILLSAPLKGDSTGSLAVDALYTSLSQAEAFLPFRDALIGLGAFLALAAVAMAIASGGEARKLAGAGVASDEAGAEPSRLASEAAAEAAHYQYETMVASGVGPGEGEDEDEAFDIPIMEMGQSMAPPAAEPEQGPQAEPELVALGKLPPATKAPAEASPAGLYSPASGLGWAEYMKERLNAEISRSASFEQDLSLLAIAYDGLSSQDRSYGEIGKAIREFFSFRDLAFERGDDGFAVILPNIDSSHAIRMAEEFFKKLVFLADGDYAELDLLPLYMGISSRAGRLVDGARLSDEASSAIERAHYEKDSHIVAFRPDPDKYRLFLASKGAS